MAEAKAPDKSSHKGNKQILVAACRELDSIPTDPQKVPCAGAMSEGAAAPLQLGVDEGLSLSVAGPDKMNRTLSSVIAEHSNQSDLTAPLEGCLRCKDACAMIFGITSRRIVARCSLVSTTMLSDIAAAEPIEFESHPKQHLVAVSTYHTLMVGGAGELFTCGDGPGVNSSVPVQLEALAGQKITCVAAGSQLSACATSNGQVYVWGKEPALVGGLLEGCKVVLIALGSSKVFAVTARGVLFAWGSKDRSALGLAASTGESTDDTVSSPTIVDGGDLGGQRPIVDVSAQDSFTVCCDVEGKAYSWGGSYYGQLGLGINGYGAKAAVPTEIPLECEQLVISVATGSEHTMLLTDQGKVLACGLNNYGQLGLGLSSARQCSSPTVYLNLHAAICLDSTPSAGSAG